MGATLVWPAVVVLGFLLFTGLVVVLGTSSTARYEFERNGAQQPARAATPRSANHPAGRRAPARSGDAAAAPARGGSGRSGSVAVRPAPAAVAEGGPTWWLVGESAQVLAGPFSDRVDADWAAFAGELPAVAVFGTRRTDGTVKPKPSPEERAWLGELGRHLDRLPAEWDDLLTDTDPLTTLVVEVAAALVEAGLPLHDPGDGQAGGGVCLVPDQDAGGLLVSWRPHDRMSLQHSRGATADEAVQRLMNAAILDVLEQLGFVVEPAGATACALVTALR
ncbi:hypothetical protein [Blastococcus goldschmidtiae]|uniref:Type VII secretion protein EccE n=1 Tax=Blastococcus goldschmidtiae TaxID=3075546 RepID=A0ABU2KAW4_9ACTN|nr:hypothetical protein [Blastococcus sp. DSM 46792]MDT0277317.1 hypothetical protein [Blastococcus sp. DSM 46792]